LIQAPTWWLFLALAPVAYWLLPARLRGGFIATVSIGLLAYFAAWDLAIMAVLAGAVFAAFRFDPDKAPAWRKRLVHSPAPFAIVLLYFVVSKYLPPVAEAFAGRGSFLHFAIPLGVSYFSFKLFHYVIEMSRGNFPKHGPVDFAAWLFLAPTFTAGPIERFEHFLAHRETTKFESRFVVEGGLRIIQGLVKKFVLGVLVAAALRWTTGGNLAHLLDRLETVSPVQVWAALFLTLAYVYLDFSAYSDIAIGSSRLFGFRIMENFNFPFLATSLPNFWQRWHMTLANFCRSYIYFPVIGLTRNPYWSMIATFAGMGLWHAASPQWIAWGLWHGGGLAGVQAYVRFANKRKLKLFKSRPGQVAGWGLTMAYVALGGSFTAVYGQRDISQSLRLMAKCFGLDI